MTIRYYSIAKKYVFSSVVGVWIWDGFIHSFILFCSLGSVIRLLLLLLREILFFFSIEECRKDKLSFFSFGLVVQLIICQIILIIIKKMFYPILSYSGFINLNFSFSFFLKRNLSCLNSLFLISKHKNKLDNKWYMTHTQNWSFLIFSNKQKSMILNFSYLFYQTFFSSYFPPSPHPPTYPFFCPSSW